ncbi:hypothetical protein CSOJ01_03772 [Colletotrichum sojae]|uniref:Uncharacterized protein n=1 Tax=Colletotrichum sojae TaxID=2175907 RepID=A0A8H6JL70_9PEZI|nr:hypothetical protein CSOJ01_03772 [Colletotrichum sojae]
MAGKEAVAPSLEIGCLQGGTARQLGEAGTQERMSQSLPRLILLPPFPPSIKTEIRENRISVASSPPDVTIIPKHQHLLAGPANALPPFASESDRPG